MTIKFLTLTRTVGQFNTYDMRMSFYSSSCHSKPVGLFFCGTKNNIRTVIFIIMKVNEEWSFQASKRKQRYHNSGSYNACAIFPSPSQSYDSFVCKKRRKSYRSGVFKLWVARPSCGLQGGTRWVAQSHLAASKFAFQWHTHSHSSV